uniref:Uncharacterized protein n=1 Tax=Coccidioides posadasii RMSCC 3488 TaxID=454284 RepID=A0A0J6ETH8_COCPO|nr:hypothetical protein CPAG_00170 [Coccidioides posadasii RMSCC 3488]
MPATATGVSLRPNTRVDQGAWTSVGEIFRVKREQVIGTLGARSTVPEDPTKLENRLKWHVEKMLEIAWT